MADTRPICCVDIGGSGVKAARIQADGSRFERLLSVPTPGTLPELVEHILGLVAAVPDCAGIAVSAPGAVDTAALRIHGSSAVPYIHDNDWPRVLSERTGLPLAIENDANCAGLAEVWFGSEDSPMTICTIVIGTGIGGSIVIDGRIHRGSHTLGGEFGYWALSLPGDGQLRDASDAASTRALVTMVTQVVGGTWDGRTVFEAADRGDLVCRDAVERWYHHLALLVHNVQYAIDPSAILIGGAVSQRPAFLDELNRALDWLYQETHAPLVRPNVGLCHFQADANLYGALAHFLQEGGRSRR